MSDNQSAVEVYKECMRNFASSLGKVANDGCQEFYYSGEDGTEEALLCAGCTCHRSFHRQVTVKVQGGKLIPNTEPIAAVPCSVYLPDGDEGDDNNAEEETPPPAQRRRMRTRRVFTAEQKERMVRFAESYDWKPYKIAGRDAVLQFCLDIGITARNFQVWLGNSRRSLKDKNPGIATATSAIGPSTSTGTDTSTGV